MSALTFTIHALLDSELVTAVVADRIFPIQAPQSAPRPHLIVSTISEDEEQTLGGAARWYAARVEVLCVGDTATQVDALGEKVKLAIGDLTNAPIGDGGSPEEIIGEVTMMKAGGDRTMFSDDRAVFWRQQDYYVRWRT
jgi:hypothetical protein